MDNFYNKLKKYILANQQKYHIELAPHFKYDETTIMSAEVANQIYALYEQLIAVQGLWEKEKDYSRLLKKENDELREELDYVYAESEDDSDDDITLNSNSEEKKYLS